MAKFTDHFRKLMLSLNSVEEEIFAQVLHDEKYSKLKSLLYETMAECKQLIEDSHS